MRLIDAKRAAEAQKMSPRNLVNFAAPQPKNILAAHAHGAAEFSLARQLIQHIEIFVVAVDKKKRGGEISFYIFARHKLIYPLAPKQPKIPEHDDEIIGAKPASKALFVILPISFMPCVSPQRYIICFLFCFPLNLARRALSQPVRMEFKR